MKYLPEPVGNKHGSPKLVAPTVVTWSCYQEVALSLEREGESRISLRY